MDDLRALLKRDRAEAGARSELSDHVAALIHQVSVLVGVERTAPHTRIVVVHAIAAAGLIEDAVALDAINDALVQGAIRNAGGAVEPLLLPTGLVDVAPELVERRPGR